MPVRSEPRPPHAEADSVKEARVLVGRRRWADAYQMLNRLDSRSALAARDLEELAVSAFLCGEGAESRHAWLRAYQIHLNRGDPQAAARCAMRIGFGQISTGELAQASGCLPATLTSCAAWVGQASSLLEDVEEGVEHGYLLVPVAYEHLVLGGDLDAAAADSARAARMARRFGDADLLALALTIRGRALVRGGSLEEGVIGLEEAVVLVGAGDVSPSVAGIALTSAVETAREAFDLNRFREWTAALRQWCELQDGMVAFRGRSLVYQATLDRVEGRWDAALDAAARACHVHLAEPDPAASASALYCQGEVLRLRGDLQAAERAYREASRRGLDPQPGLALLRLAGGDVEAAIAATDRALGEAKSLLGRAVMLPARVEIFLAGGDMTAASATAAELAEAAGAYSTPVLEAGAHHARGAVLLAEGDPSAALEELRVAVRVWSHLGVPYEEARTRVLIAECCRTLGDVDAASLELGIARGIFSALPARPDVARVDSLLAAPLAPHGLSRRELEVLRLVAQGLTNREIAEELIVATRTVDSHVSHILTKLGVPTRAAATAFAHRHNLL